MTLHPDAKLMVTGQISYSVFLITGDLFCTFYFLHLKTGQRFIGENIDSVEKNLHIEKDIAKELKSIHVPYHFLCKPHTVEA